MQALNNNQTEFEKIANIIRENEKFLIVTHDFPDGDCLGSQVALYELLIKLNKNASMLCTSDIPYQYKFLPHINAIEKELNRLSADFFSSECVCFCLDSADEKRFKLDIEKLKQKINVLINIDHHLGNTMYGDINVVDSSKSATAEMIYEFIYRHFKFFLNYDIAVGLYTGILTDTGRFQYENTTDNVHKIISHLLEFNIVPPKIYSYIYENEPLERFKLLEIVLQRIRLSDSKKLIYSYVLQEDFKKLNLPFSANDGLIELLRTASGVKVAALIKQVNEGHYKVSLRSSDRDYSVVDIAVKFGGGGHRLAAAYAKDGSLKEVIQNLIDEVESI